MEHHLGMTILEWRYCTSVPYFRPYFGAISHYTLHIGHISLLMVTRIHWIHRIRNWWFTNFWEANKNHRFCGSFSRSLLAIYWDENSSDTPMIPILHSCCFSGFPSFWLCNLPETLWIPMIFPFYSQWCSHDIPIRFQLHSHYVPIIPSYSH